MFDWTDSSKKCGVTRVGSYTNVGGIYSFYTSAHSFSFLSVFQVVAKDLQDFNLLPVLGLSQQFDLRSCLLMHNPLEA